MWAAAAASKSKRAEEELSLSLSLSLSLALYLLPLVGSNMAPCALKLIPPAKTQAHIKINFTSDTSKNSTARWQQPAPQAFHARTAAVYLAPRTQFLGSWANSRTQLEPWDTLRIFAICAFIFLRNFIHFVLACRDLNIKLEPAPA
jgi:hypothetical protein